jgi:membrane dipeptidase
VARLSPFGRQVVAELNRVGILVDVSHVSDEAFLQAVEASAVPAIASHSSARRFTPGFERNASDELIRALAARGGVLMINFGSGFTSAKAKAYWDAGMEAMMAEAQRLGVPPGSPALEAWQRRYVAEHPPVYATVADVADHFDHVRALVGVDHVGIGSDFEGLGPSMPRDLVDVSRYPVLFAELLRRGWTEEELAKVASGNLFRVWRAAEAYAAAHAAPR